MSGPQPPVQLPQMPPEPEAEIATREAMQAWRTANAAALTDLDDKWEAFRTKVRTTKDPVSTEVTELKAAIDTVAAIPRT